MLFLVLYLTFRHKLVNLTVPYKACLSQVLKMGSQQHQIDFLIKFSTHLTTSNSSSPLFITVQLNRFKNWNLLLLQTILQYDSICFHIND